MSDLSESPIVTVDLCPICEPDYDYRALLNLRNCHRHEPSMVGEVENMFPEPYHVPGECDGVDNKLWCDFLHRNTRVNSPK